MLNNFRNLQSLLWSHGSHWLMFRVGYALRKRTGFLRRQMPAYAWSDRQLETWLKKNIPAAPKAYTEWRRQNLPKFFFPPTRAERRRSDREGVDEAQMANDLSWNPRSAVEEADRMLNGELKLFAHRFIQTGFPPNWHKNPVSGVQLDSSKHWSDISDDVDIDIKFIWEASRFSMVYTLVRAYASTGDEKYPEAFWRLIESWADANPPNTGPNWMDGQEAALRLTAWAFGYYQFFDSPSATPERIAKFTVLVAAHAERIYKNIDYAISTQSNHTISEAFGLWLVGLLFPELKEAEKYFSLGRRLLEQEALTQIFPDGTYAMYSLNYHRFVLHLYLYAMRLGQLNNFPFSEALRNRISKSIDTLYQLIDTKSGQMPVYGSNDGALVLPLNNCDFTDYRPLLQLGSYITKKQFLFEPGPWDEDVWWLCSPLSLEGRGAGVRLPPLQTSFPDGGVFLLRGTDSKAVIRCTDYRARPSHADQLHVDLWIRGQNIACDAGTYLYSGKDPWRNGLAHTPVHNTVTVDHKDQMKMLTRFTWTNWARGKVLQHEQKNWEGEHNGYKRLADPVLHHRRVVALPDDHWLIMDELTATKTHHYALHWLLMDAEYELLDLSPSFGLSLRAFADQTPSSNILFQVTPVGGSANFSVVRADPASTRGWRSRYYGDKEPALSVMLETEQASFAFITSVGFEKDLDVLKEVEEWGIF